MALTKSNTVDFFQSTELSSCLLTPLLQLIGSVAKNAIIEAFYTYILQQLRNILRCSK